MKRILGTLIAASALMMSVVVVAQNPEAEDFSGKSQKRPGNSLIVKINPNGTKSVFSINSDKKLSKSEFQKKVKELESSGEALAQNSVNPESEDLGVAPSWYYAGGSYYGPNGSIHGGVYGGPYGSGAYVGVQYNPQNYYYGYGAVNYGYTGYYPTYYNNYRYNYGYYYQPMYNPYWYGNCNWHYYY